MMLSAKYKGYTVFEDGTVIGLKGTILKPGISSNGYYTVVICFEDKKQSVCIHRLVAESFIPNPENKRTVNHKNGNKKDNRVCNLEWATDQENIQHAFNTGLNAKVGPAVRKKMQKTVIDTSTGQQYPSAKAAATAFGIKENSLRSRLCGFRINNTNLKYLQQ